MHRPSVLLIKMGAELSSKDGGQVRAACGEAEAGPVSAAPQRPLPSFLICFSVRGHGDDNVATSLPQLSHVFPDLKVEKMDSSASLDGDLRKEISTSPAPGLAPLSLGAAHTSWSGPV